MNRVIRFVNILCILAGFSSIGFATSADFKKLSCQQIDNTQICQYDISNKIGFIFTKMPYALCAQANCTRQTDEANVATCTCPIYGIGDSKDTWQSISLGDKGYGLMKPEYQQGKLVTVISNFSLAMAKSMDQLDIPSTVCKQDKPTPWANCFGVRC